MRHEGRGRGRYRRHRPRSSASNCSPGRRIPSRPRNLRDRSEEGARTPRGRALSLKAKGDCTHDPHDFRRRHRRRSSRQHCRVCPDREAPPSPGLSMRSRKVIIAGKGRLVAAPDQRGMARSATVAFGSSSSSDGARRALLLRLPPPMITRGRSMTRSST